MGNRNSILEGLAYGRRTSRIVEGVSNVVKSDLKKLYSKSGADGNIQKNINNALNSLYLVFNSVGENEFDGSNYSYNRGNVVDVGDGESGLIGLDVDPACHSLDIKVSTNKSRETVKAAVDFIKKGKSKLKYSDYSMDPLGITFYYDGEDDYTYSYVAIEDRKSYVSVEVGVCKNPLNESISEGTALVFKKLEHKASNGTNLAVSNLGDDEEYILTDLAEAEPKNDADIVKALNKNKNIYGKFSLSKRTIKDGCVVQVEDKDGNKSYLNVYYDKVNESYISEAKDNKVACARGGNLFSRLGFAFSKYCNDVECSLKGIETNYRRGGAIVQIDIIIRDANEKARAIVRDFRFKPADVSVTSQDKLKDGCSGYRLEDNLEAITAFIRFINKQTGELRGCVTYKDISTIEESVGTEVGLPIDKENCEGTDASCISTPSGKLGSNKGNVVTCPKCGSENVNIRDGVVLHCTDCDYEWKIEGKDGKEGDKVAESGLNEVSYKVGKRYKTDDGMFFVVKKINRDGSIRVYDEDVEKEYDCEKSDLELLNPIMVK